MFYKILRHIKNCLINISDRILVYIRRKNELKKFKDNRRKEIYNSIELTHQQQKEIDTLFVENYGKKIPYTWHKHCMAFTGKFDSKYFPEMLYIPEFEHYMNDQEEYNKVYADKNVLPLIVQSIGGKMPDIIVAVSNGIYLSNTYNAISKEEAIRILQNCGKVFCKPTVETGSGKGCFIADFHNGIERVSKKSVEQILSSMGKNFVIQQCIKCHESIKKIYPNSVNTFRIITYRWREEYFHMPVIMRIGQGGSFVDNAHAGGMFIALDDDGTMHKEAYTEFKKVYTHHPDTGLVFDGYKIDLLPTVINTAKRMHAIMPQVGVVNWDFTIDENGIPVLIETNIRGGSIWLMQIAHGRGVFGDNTVEVLNWLKKMKKIKKTDRKDHRFGR